MIEILAATFQTALREDVWNRNSYSHIPDPEIEKLQRRNDTKQRWKRIISRSA